MKGQLMHMHDSGETMIDELMISLSEMSRFRVQ